VITFDQAISNGSLKITGNSAAFKDLLGMMDTFPFFFNIITP
jgi:alkyl sulfatase BDS1-like metallo-beta-lactamase superfamily hydrolase